MDANHYPTCTLSVDISLPSDAMESNVRSVCKALIQKWSHTEDSKLIVSRISGGITNLLLKVTVDDSEDPLTVRVFGPNTDAVIDRKSELQAIPHLSKAGFGPKLLGVFANGMIQSFIQARTLDPVDMAKREIAPLIAREMRRLHELDIPGSKEPQLWQNISKYFNIAGAISFREAEKQKKLDMISFDDLRNEIAALKETSDSLGAPVVYCHNDLLSGNLMLDESSGKLHLIDFEYGCYNYRGFDIGNHFNEYAGFECDYSLYPDKDVQYHFLRHYLHPHEPLKASDAELHSLYFESNFYALASHLLWAIWAIVQAKYSLIEFDYLEYFFQRFREYKRRKQELLSNLPDSRGDDSPFTYAEFDSFLKRFVKINTAPLWRIVVFHSSNQAGMVQAALREHCKAGYEPAIWLKTNVRGNGGGARLVNVWEQIHVGYQSVGGQRRILHYNTAGMDLRNAFQCPAVLQKLTDPVHQGRMVNPYQKPQRLINTLLEMFSQPGDWVVDAFSGSGTTLACALQKGHNCLAVDIDKDSVDYIRSRISSLHSLLDEKQELGLKDKDANPQSDNDSDEELRPKEVPMDI